jgi:hypothetical protein
MLKSLQDEYANFAGSFYDWVSVWVGRLLVAFAALGMPIMADALYADTNAVAFCNSVGVFDDSARRDMDIAVSDLKRMNVWTNLVDAFIFHPRFNSTNHLSLLGNPWNFTNEVYNNWGAQLYHTNIISAILPANLTNYTLFVVFRQSAAGLDAGDSTAGPLNNLAELRSTYDGSAIMLASWCISFSARIWSSSGTNWTYDTDWTVQSNRISPMLSGGFGYGSAVAPIIKSVYAISGDYRGNYQVWVNGRPAALGQYGKTNILTMNPITAPLNQILIGGGDTSWFATSNGGQTATNAFGVTVMAVFVFNQTINSNIATAGEAFATDLENCDSAVSFQGSSIINDAVAACSGTGVPLTNSIPLLFEQMNPRTMVLQEAIGGSFIASYDNEFNGWSNGIPFRSAISLLSVEKYTNRTIKTDAPRNDALSGTTVTNCVRLFNQVYAPYWTSGIRIELIDTPYAGNVSIANNQNWQAACAAIATNFPLAAHWALSRWITYEYLATVSRDNPPVHLNAASLAGYTANKNVASFVAGDPWPIGFTGGTNLAVSGSPYIFTNYYPYPVMLDISGGAIQGINKGGVPMFTQGVINGSLMLCLDSGETVCITNWVAPSIYLDSTQPPCFPCTVTTRALGLEGMTNGDTNVVCGTTATVLAPPDPGYIFANVTVSATPNPGYVFANWTENGFIITNSPAYTFTADASRNLVANFLQTDMVMCTNSISTASSPSFGGSTSDSGTVNCGSSVTVSATPSPCFSFVNWMVDGTVVSASSSYTFTNDGNLNFAANFVPAVYSIDISTSLTNGGSASGGGTVDCGSSVTVTAVTNANYRFVGWTGNGYIVSTSPIYTFIPSVSGTLMANFLIITYAISVSSSPLSGGSVNGGGIVDSGASVTMTANPNSGYTFLNWMEGETVVSASSNYTFTGTGNRILIANFVPQIPLLGFSSPLWNIGRFNLMMFGPIGSNYEIDASTNLFNWIPLTNFVSTTSPIYFSDQSATNYKRRFYRAVTQ